MLHSRKVPPLEQYEGHLNRLIQMKYEHPKNHQHSIDSLKKADQKHHSLEKRKVRLKTEGHKEKQLISQSMPMKSVNRIDLPLIPQLQKELVGQYINSAHLESHQHELFLKNYLLSRRILHATPCIKVDQFKKSFKKHILYGNLRSRGRLQTVNQSHSRLERYKTFEEKRDKMERVEQSHGSGRFEFILHVKAIHTIIRHREEGKLYNLLIKVGGKTLKYPLLTPHSLKSPHSFHFKKKQTSKANQIELKLYAISNNDIYQYGQFEIDVSVPFQQICELSKYQEYQYRKQNMISNLKSIKNQKTIGTVLYDYSIKT